MQLIFLHGATLLPVNLTCSDQTLATRITNPDRATRRKLNSVSGLNTYLAKHAAHRLPRDNCITVSTDTQTPQQAAAQIMQKHSLAPR